MNLLNFLAAVESSGLKYSTPGLKRAHYSFKAADLDVCLRTNIKFLKIRLAIYVTQETPPVFKSLKKRKYSRMNHYNVPYFNNRFLQKINN